MKFIKTKQVFENRVSNHLPGHIDDFLQSIAQMTGAISYTDIMEYDYTDSHKSMLADIMEVAHDGEDFENTEEFQQLINLVKNVVTESASDEATMYDLDTIAKLWDQMYGEDFIEEYDGLAEEIGDRKMTKEEFFALWDKLYGEDFEEEYSGLAEKM